MIRRIRVFGVTVLEVESTDDPEGAPDFTASAHPAGFVRGDLPLYHRDDLVDDARDARDT